MNSNEIEKIIKKGKPADMSETERGVLWGSVMHTIDNTEVVESSGWTYSSIFDVLRTKRIALVSLLSIAFLGGSTATVFASNDARPGDLLFPIDRAVEEIAVFFAAPEDEVVLREGQVRERLEEIRTVFATETMPESEEANEDIPSGLMSVDEVSVVSVGIMNYDEQDEQREISKKEKEHFEYVYSFIADVEEELGDDIERVKAEVDSFARERRYKPQLDEEKDSIEHEEDKSDEYDEDKRDNKESSASIGGGNSKKKTNQKSEGEFTDNTEEESDGAHELESGEEGGGILEEDTGISNDGIVDTINDSEDDDIEGGNNPANQSPGKKKGVQNENTTLESSVEREGKADNSKADSHDSDVGSIEGVLPSEKVISSIEVELSGGRAHITVQGEGVEDEHDEELSEVDEVYVFLKDTYDIDRETIESLILFK